MARPKTGGRTTRSQAAAGATDSGIKKTPGGRVGDKANKLGEGQKSTAGESQPAQPAIEDVAMGEAPSINEPTDSVSDSPAQSNHPSTESTPAQSNLPSTESTPAQSNLPSTGSTPANAHGPPGGDDPDEVVLLKEAPDVHFITKQMKKARIHQEGEELLAIVTISAGNKWKIFGFGPRNVRDYAMFSWKSYQALKNYRMTENEKKLELQPITWKERKGRNERMTALGGVAVPDRDIFLLVPKEGKKWPPANIRILVKWKKRGDDVTVTSWEKFGVVEIAWVPGTTYIDPKKAKLASTRNSGRLCKKDKTVTILEDIPVGRGVLKKGQQITELQYAIIDAAVRCRQRYEESLTSKDKDNVADRYATPDLTGNGNGDPIHDTSEGTRYIASKEALGTVVKVEETH